MSAQIKQPVDFDIEREINSIIESEIAEGRSVPITMAVIRVVEAHSAIEGPDKAFNLHCANGHVRALARRVIQRTRAVGTQQEFTFEGYEHLQSRYTTKEGGEWMVVPTHLCSDEQLRAKAAELRQMGRGCFAHADEIDAYIDARS